MIDQQTLVRMIRRDEAILDSGKDFAITEERVATLLTARSLLRISLYTVDLPEGQSIQEAMDELISQAP